MRSFVRYLDGPSFPMSCLSLVAQHVSVGPNFWLHEEFLGFTKDLFLLLLISPSASFLNTSFGSTCVNFSQAAKLKPLKPFLTSRILIASWLSLVFLAWRASAEKPLGSISLGFYRPDYSSKRLSQNGFQHLSEFSEILRCAATPSNAAECQALVKKAHQAHSVGPGCPGKHEANAPDVSAI